MPCGMKTLTSRHLPYASGITHWVQPTFAKEDDWAERSIRRMAQLTAVMETAMQGIERRYRIKAEEESWS